MVIIMVLDILMMVLDRVNNELCTGSDDIDSVIILILIFFSNIFFLYIYIYIYI